MKRFNNEEDKRKIIELKKDIFDTSKSIESIFDKYNIKKVYKMDDVKTKLNICLFNFMRSQIFKITAVLLFFLTGFASAQNGFSSRAPSSRRTS